LSKKIKKSIGQRLDSIQPVFDWTNLNAILFVNGKKGTEFTLTKWYITRKKSVRRSS